MSVLKRLVEWQKNQAKKAGIEKYMVLPFPVLREISRVLPRNEKELLDIKGIGRVKVRKYGRDILNIVSGKQLDENFDYYNNSHSRYQGQIFDEFNSVNEMLEQKVDRFLKSSNDKNLVQQDLFDSNASISDSKHNKKKLNIDKKTGEILEEVTNEMSISEFLAQLNQILNSYFTKVKLRGEIIGFKRNQNGHAYFELKDDQSILRVSLFKTAYDLSAVKLGDGMEILITGRPEYHKKYGFSFIGEFVELAGQGALKKAYEDLKNKLNKEGLFDANKKRKIPKLPTKIGLITSKSGAAIGDFVTNLGKYGFEIFFHHSSVEGENATKELIGALKYFENKEIDVLVVVRGGGSLESLNAFNNENVVRQIASFPVPVVVGVGHEQDETLSTLVADIGVSTPTAAARVVRESWDREIAKIDVYKSIIFDKFENAVFENKNFLDKKTSVIFGFFDDLNDKYLEYRDVIKNKILQMDRIFLNYRLKCEYFEKVFDYNNPLNELKRGYSITKDNKGVVLKDIRQISQDDEVCVLLSNGSFNALISKINKK